MAWRTLSLPKVPDAVTSAASALSSVLSTTTTVLGLVEAVLNTLSNVVPGSLDASQAIIAAAVATINSAVTSLTNDTGVYVLLVPPHSRVIIPDPVKAALSSVFTLPPTTTALNTQAMFAGKQMSQQQTQLLQGLTSATGGNAGFVRSVIESFDDGGDDNRPVLQITDAVTGFYIVAGASNIATLMPFTNGASALLAPKRPNALDAPSVPAPQGLTAKVVTGASIRLGWTFQQPLVELPALATFAKVTEIAVIRSTATSFMSASTPLELFGTNMLTAGMKTGDGLTEVVAVVPYTGIDLKSTYLDNTALTVGASYYYGISFHVKLGTSAELSGSGGTDIGFPRLSNVTKIHLSKVSHSTPRSITGVPPDWYRTPRVADLFPAIGDLLNQMASLATQFGDTTGGYKELLKANVALLEQQIKSYTDVASQLTAASQSIAAFGSLNLGTVSIRGFSGTGGTEFVKQDIVTAFGDTTDPNRPPFDGNEFVSGVVILATTPSAQALLETLLGSVSASAGVIADALAQIDVQLSAVETAVFGDNLQPTTTSAPVVAIGLPQIGPGAYCFHSFESNPTFGDDLKPTE